MIRAFWVALVGVLLWAAPLWGGLSECVDATCRITGPEKMLDNGQMGHDSGTGCAFYHPQGAIWVLTCAHVVADEGQYRVEFWSQGHQSNLLPGRVVSRDRSIDAAIVEVAESAFDGRLPLIIPLAAADESPRAGDAVSSAGCPLGAWVSAWRGHVLGYRAQDLVFVPPPQDGRSGSAIFDAEGTKIVGLLHSRLDSTGEGFATSIVALRGQLYATCDHVEAVKPLVPVVATQGLQQTQCPGGRCPMQPPPQYRVLPYRQQQEAQKGNAWPTLPAPAASPPVDLSGVQNQLGQIAQRVEELRPQRPAVQDAPPQPDGTARQALETAEQAMGMATSAKRRVDEIEAAGKQAIGKVEESQAKLNDLVAKHGTLSERFEARKAEVDAKLGDHASKFEKAHEFARSLIEDKIGALKDGHGDTRLIMLIVVLAGVGVFVVIVLKDIQHKKKGGDPLIIEKLAARLTASATGHPLIAPAANLASHAASDLAHIIDARIQANKQAAAADQAAAKAIPVPPPQ